MKKIFLAVLAVSGLALAAGAQCNQSVQLTTTKTYFLNAAYEVQGSKDEQVIVAITKTNITIVPEGKQENALSGTIKDIQCEWKVPFKEGKTVIKSDLVDAGGDVKEATITIEGKDGKISLTAEAKERPDQKLRLDVAKYEPKN